MCRLHISTTVTETFNIIKLPCMGVMDNCVLIVNIEKRNVKHPVYVCTCVCVIQCLLAVKSKSSQIDGFTVTSWLTVKTYL
jgi:hypothetical protein